ncbi:MAG: SOS cell division inhibitor SulA [Planctomycetota bacterium]
MKAAYDSHDINVGDLRDRLRRREIRLAEDLLLRAERGYSHDNFSTGEPALDEILGGGLRRGALNELCLEGEAGGALEFLLPGLARTVLPGDETARSLFAWVHPERQPYPPALAARGLALDRLLAVRPADPREHLWALEVLLDSGLCGLVLSPLPRASDAALRRLQLAARRAGATALLLRDARAAESPSPAPLRLRARPRPAPGPGRRALEIEVFKRPGLRAPLALQMEWSPDALDARPLLRLRDRPDHALAPRGGSDTPRAVPHGA